MLVYGVVSSQTEKAIELLPTRGQAEAFIAEVEADEPKLAALLRGRGGPARRVSQPLDSRTG